MNKDNDTRPISFDSFVGQKAVIDVLRRAIVAARSSNRACSHMLLTGGPGLGKTSIASMIAHEMGTNLHAIMAPAVEHKGALIGLLTGARAGDVIFIDEIHALKPALQECLYSALEDGVVDLQAGKRVIRMTLAPFTLIGATTRAALLTAPLRDRFAYTFQLRPYAADAIAEIVRRAANPLGLVIEPAACAEIARRSRGVPRVALRLLRAARDFAASAGCGPFVSTVCAAAALDAIGVDELGLEGTDRSYLTIVAAAGAPIGLDAVCAELGEERRTIEEVVEPYLLAAGLIRRTRAGRVVAAAGVAHLQPKEPRWAPEDRMIGGGNVEDAEVLS